MDKPVVIQTGGVSKYAIIAIVVLIAAVIAYFVIYKPWRKQQDTLQNNAIDTSTKDGIAKVLATKLRVAMKGWGTKEKLMYEVADQIRENKIPWVNVAAAYLKMYNRDLVKDVQSELDSKEIVEFWRRVDPKTAPAQQNTQTPAVTTKSAITKAAIKTAVATSPFTNPFSFLF